MAKKKKRARSRAITRTRTRYITRRPARRRRRAHGGGGTSMVKVAAAAAAIGYIQERTQLLAPLSKVPGAKTFGTPAALGVVALAANKFIKPHPMLRLVGLAGLAVAAYNLGSKGFNVTWVGDDEGYELAGEDLAELDIGADDEDLAGDDEEG